MADLNSVVQIIVSQSKPAFTNMVAGTGWFFKHENAEEGTLLTNAHVVKQAQDIFIRLPCNHSVDIPVFLKAISTDLDLAVIQLAPDQLKMVKSELYDKYGSSEIPKLTIGDSDAMLKRVNGQQQPVFAVGNPLGNEYQSTTHGVISGVKHAMEQLYLTSTATINPGNSGGPAKNLKGEVIGINSMKVKGAEEINMLIPSNRILAVLPTMLDNSKNEQEIEKMLKVAAHMYDRKPEGITNEQLLKVTHLMSEVHADFDVEKAAMIWESHKLGGMRRAKEGIRAVKMSEWYAKYVDGSHDAHRLFSDVLNEIHAEHTDEIHKMRAVGFASFQCEECDHKMDCKKKGMHNQLKISKSQIPPMVLSMPRLAMKLSNSTGAPTLKKYGAPKHVKGGVIVSDVVAGGMMDRAGLKKYDFIYKVQTEKGSFPLDNYGESWMNNMMVSLPLRDIIHRSSFNKEITLNVIRNKEMKEVKFTYLPLEQQFKPNIRILNTLQDMPLTRQVCKIAGITMTPMRLNHVMQFRKAEYMNPHKQNEFKIIVLDIDTHASAFHARNIVPGDIITKINDAETGKSWKDFVDQIRSVKESLSLECDRGEILIL